MITPIPGAVVAGGVVAEELRPVSVIALWGQVGPVGASTAIG